MAAYLDLQVLLAKPRVGALLPKVAEHLQEALQGVPKEAFQDLQVVHHPEAPNPAYHQDLVVHQVDPQVDLQVVRLVPQDHLIQEVHQVLEVMLLVVHQGHPVQVLEFLYLMLVFFLGSVFAVFLPLHPRYRFSSAAPPPLPVSKS